SGYQECQCAKTVHRILHSFLNASLSLEVPKRENKSRKVSLPMFISSMLRQEAGCWCSLRFRPSGADVGRGVADINYKATR
ncbi:MAG: hypothetical protein ACOYLC_07910, partial [Armatimonadaceae bacterium]